MAVEDTLKNKMKSAGFFLPNKIGLRAKLTVLVALFTLGNTLAAVFTNWSNVHKRFAALEDLNATFGFFNANFEYAVGIQRLSKLILLLEQEFCIYDDVDQLKRKLTEITKDTNQSLHNKVEICVKIFIANTILVKFIFPLFLAVLKGGFQNNLPVIFEFVCRDPVNVSAISYYIIVILLQFYYLLSCYPTGTCSYSSGITAMNRVSAEIKLLTVSINQLDRNFGSHNIKNEHGNYAEYHDFEKSQVDKKLIIWTRNTVHHHQLIIRMVKELNKGLAVICTIINQLICGIFCLALYYFLEVSNMLLKIKAITSAVVVLGLLFYYTTYGQDISNESENLREALYSCSWVNKPRWFKKTLLIMMTCSNKPLIINPFGIYVLNLRNYSVVLNAGYSFFNFLKTFQK